mmetsp:Transcript_42690/g.100201  ORF Transcript_42690/g.100201 Transcript_42690/m.100201 type:complete len:120 (+) Transcript_42690:823-1182(+)
MLLSLLPLLLLPLLLLQTPPPPPLPLLLLLLLLWGGHDVPGASAVLVAADVAAIQRVINAAAEQTRLSATSPAVLTLAAATNGRALCGKFCERCETRVLLTQKKEGKERIRGDGDSGAQ